RELAAQLSAAVTPQEVLDIVADRVGALLGAHMINISVLNPAGDTLSLVITRQTSKGAQDRFATYPVDAPLPSRDALMSRQPVLIRNLAERHERYPVLAGENAEHRSFAVLPLLSAGRALGVLALGWHAEQDYPTSTVVMAEEVAALCAAALDRAERY